jgi:hypothetical protein
MSGPQASQAAFTCDQDDGTVLSANGDITEIKMNNSGKGHYTVSNDGAFRINNTENATVAYTPGENLMSITSTGNVGIGLTGPTSKLHVVGLITAIGITGSTVNATDISATGITGSNITGSNITGSTSVNVGLGPEKITLTAGIVSAKGITGTSVTATNITSTSGITGSTITAIMSVNVGSGPEKITLSGSNGIVSAKGITGTSVTATNITGTLITASTSVTIGSGIETITLKSSTGAVTSKTVSAIETISAKNISATETISAKNISATETISALGITGTNITASLVKVGPQITLATDGMVTATSFTAASDYRVKKDIYPFSLEEYSVDKLKPVKFKYTSSHQDSIGLIAHEVQEHYPFLVEGTKDGDKTQSVNYIGLVGVLIKEVQELKHRVFELEKKIE